MKNITINLIEQNVLENVLSENFKHHNFKILSYKGFSEFITHHDKKKLSINVSNVDNYDLFVLNYICPLLLQGLLFPLQYPKA